MKRWIHLFGSALTLGSFVYFGAYIWRYRDQIPRIHFSWYSAGLVAVLVLIQVAVTMGGALAWREIVGFSGNQVLSPKRAIAIFCKTQFAKYIPGNIAHHLGRLLLARNEGVSAKRATLSQTIEILWNAGCAGVLGVYGLSQLVATGNDAISYLVKPWAIALLAAVAILGPVVGLPWGLRLLKRTFPERVAQDIQIRLPVFRSLACMAAYLLSFLYMGLAMNGLASSLFELPALNLGFVSSICALAWVAGFVTPGSPAGIGVRDTILLLALKPYYGVEAAGAAILAHRILITLGDLVVFGFGVLVERGLAVKAAAAP